MRTRLTLTPLLLALPTFVVAATTDFKSKCEGPDTSSRYEACVEAINTKEAEIEIKKQEQNIYKYAPKSEHKNIAASIKAWEAYREKACQTQQAVMGGISSVSWNRCMESLTRQRLEYLRTNY